LKEKEYHKLFPQRVVKCTVWAKKKAPSFWTLFTACGHISRPDTILNAYHLH